MGLVSLSVILLIWRVQILTRDNKDLKSANTELSSSLLAEQQSSKKQVDALTKDKEDESKRAETLTQKLLKLEKTNEKAKCSMPDFMRDSYKRM